MYVLSENIESKSVHISVNTSKVKDEKKETNDDLFWIIHSSMRQAILNYLIAVKIIEKLDATY